MNIQQKLIIDNTAIHSEGRALSGTVTGRSEYLDLLQFTNQLLFVDSLEVFTFEYNPIRQRTDSVRRKLKRCGVSIDLLAGKGYKAATYARLCRRAAKRLGEDFDLVFPLFEISSEQGRLSRGCRASPKRIASLIDYSHHNTFPNLKLIWFYPLN